MISNKKYDFIKKCNEFKQNMILVRKCNVFKHKTRFLMLLLFLLLLMIFMVFTVSAWCSYENIRISNKTHGFLKEIHRFQTNSIVFLRKCNHCISTKTYSFLFGKYDDFKQTLRFLCFHCFWTTFFAFRPWEWFQRVRTAILFQVPGLSVFRSFTCSRKQPCILGPHASANPPAGMGVCIHHVGTWIPSFLA